MNKIINKMGDNVINGEIYNIGQGEVHMDENNPNNANRNREGVLKEISVISIITVISIIILYVLIIIIFVIQFTLNKNKSSLTEVNSEIEDAAILLESLNFTSNQ